MVSTFNFWILITRSEQYTKQVGFFTMLLLTIKQMVGIDMHIYILKISIGAFLDSNLQPLVRMVRYFTLLRSFYWIRFGLTRLFHDNFEAISFITQI